MFQLIGKPFIDVCTVCLFSQQTIIILIKNLKSKLGQSKVGVTPWSSRAAISSSGFLAN